MRNSSINKISAFETCFSPLLHIVQNRPVSVGTQDFANFVIEQYNSDKTGKFEWTAGPDFGKWAKNTATKVSKALNGNRKMIGQINKLFTLKYKNFRGQMRSCGNTYRNLPL